jgi:hypothetical protein
MTCVSGGAALIRLKPVRLDWPRPAHDFIDNKLCKVFRRSALRRNTRNPEFMQALQSIAILPEARLVPSGVVRLMELQEKGWSYVRP